MKCQSYSAQMTQLNVHCTAKDIQEKMKKLKRAKKTNQKQKQLFQQQLQSCFNSFKVT